MSGSGSTPTNPVPAPRRGSKLKEPSASDKLYNFKTQFGNFMSLYEWMDKLENGCCAYQKRINVTKVGRPTEKRTFVVLEEGESFTTRVLLSVRNKG